MRTVAISILLFICAGVFLLSFGFKAPPTTEASQLRDVTDTLLPQPNAGEIENLYQLEGENRWHGGIFRFSNVTDVSYNNWKEARIPATNEWLSNEFERDKQIKDFKESIG